MNLLHLKYAVEIEKTGSITKAANNLFMGQPNLSKAIKELENEIGITIFRRTTKGVAPTEKGGEFLGYAKDFPPILPEQRRAWYILPFFSVFTRDTITLPHTPQYTFPLKTYRSLWRLVSVGFLRLISAWVCSHSSRLIIGS